ncbi:O-unit flippase-like protein [Flavobacterium praedii]|uniref:O-unit flippase-like protein n=1 Tax=Flavobacterium praedii TaxID=3002900 RepID=UPI002481EABB|nr:O-unit flippase-like protein [Flavobacterium praedii]
MSIVLSKKDIFWGYFAQFFSIASGVITLPLILRMLTKEEIGLNYLLLTFGSLVSLFDFGFASQFGRNISYIFGGAQSLQKEGIQVESYSREINYRLLATMIHTARYVYRRIGLVVLATLLTFGTWYIYEVTNGFKTVHNALIIWFIFSFSVFFEMFYSYYTALLGGRGMIMESRKAIVYSRMVYVILAFVFLYMGFGLIGVVIANFIAPFFNRIISYRFFFTEDLKSKIDCFDISKKEKLELFNIVWYNARKMGLVFIGAYAINKFSLFLAGLYLPLSEIASYGLMIQLVGLISTVSGTFFLISQSKFSAMRVNEDKEKILKEFAFSMNVYYLLFVFGAVFLVIVCPWLLIIIGAKAKLPSVLVLCVFALIVLLEGNHSNFAGFIITKNNIPFVKSSLIAGLAIVLGDYFSLVYTTYGILGLVVVQGLSQIAYANWKWPYVVCKEFGISFLSFVEIGMKESLIRLKIK